MLVGWCIFKLMQTVVKVINTVVGAVSNSSWCHFKTLSALCSFNIRWLASLCVTTAKSPCQEKSSPCQKKSTAAAPCSEKKSTEDSLTLLSGKLCDDVSQALSDTGSGTLPETCSEDLKESIDLNDCKTSMTSLEFENKP